MKFSPFLYKIILSGVLTAVLVASVLYSQERSKNVSLQARVLELEEDLKKISADLQKKINAVEEVSIPAEEAPKKLPTLSSDQKIVEPVAKESPEKPEEKITIERIAAFRARRELAQLESITVVSEEDRERLEAMYRAKFEGREPEETLEDIFGPELAKEVQAEQERIREERRSERVRNEVYILSRKLNLSSEQEVQAKEIISKVNQETREIFRSVMSPERIANEPHQGPKQHVEMFQEIGKIRDEKLGEEMKQILSDEQYNTFLEDQASRPSRGWRRPF